MISVITRKKKKRLKKLLCLSVKKEKGKVCLYWREQWKKQKLICYLGKVPFLPKLNCSGKNCRVEVNQDRGNKN